MYLSIPQLIQKLLRVKYQLRSGCWSHDDRLCIDFLIFFDDGNGHFREFVGAHVAIIKEQRLFRGEKIEHVFSGLVVSDAVAAELEMSEGCDFVWIVGDGVFLDEFEAEFSFKLYFMVLEEVLDVFFCMG
jgi:hypothetical protein